MIIRLSLGGNLLPSKEEHLQQLARATHFFQSCGWPHFYVSTELQMCKNEVLSKLGRLWRRDGHIGVPNQICGSFKL